MQPVVLLSFLLATQFTFAADQVGTITQADGTVKVFSHPGKTIQGPGPHALFEGEYFSVRDAKIGDRIEKGNILRTAPGSKAKVIYDNGDQFLVGPGTAYRITWDKDDKSGKTDVNLLYGKIRGIVEKGGPRSKLKIRTASATMGVRGTDFFVADGGREKGTEISILRGSVEVKPDRPTAKPIEVKAGQSAEVPPPPPPPPAPPKTAEKGKETQKAPPPAEEPKIEIRQTTKQELAGIQRSSEIVKPKEELKKAEAIPKEIAEKLEKLEKKAVETVITDIKKEDPKLYEQISKNKDLKEIKSAEDLNTVAVVSLAKTAPKAPEEHKPYKSELEDLEGGAYEKYFKIVE